MIRAVTFLPIFEKCEKDIYQPLKGHDPKSSEMNKAVYFDRDGIINRKLENDYVKNWELIKAVQVL